MSSFCSDSKKLSTVAPQEEEEDEESFGTLSDKYSSRRLFHKSTAQLYNLQLKEQGVEEEELEPKLWQGRRNTPYWYFFQCKRLIKEGKVREPWGLPFCWVGICGAVQPSRLLKLECSLLSPWISIVFVYR